MEQVNKKKYILGLLVSILVIGIGTTFAYFATRSMLTGSGTTAEGTTVTLGDTTVNIEGSLDFNDLNIYPGHKNISKIKVTATGDRNVLYNLIWNGTNSLKTSLSYTVYKTITEQNPNITCEKKQEGNLETIFYETCTESNFTNLGEVVSSGVIPSIQDSSIRLVRNESIQATTSGETVYYYVVLEYPNKETSQNIDMNGSFNGEVTIELIEQEQVCNNYNANTSLGVLAVKDCEPELRLYLDDEYKEKYGIDGALARGKVIDFDGNWYWTDIVGEVYTFRDSEGNDVWDQGLPLIDSSVLSMSLGDAIWNEENSTCTYNGVVVTNFATGDIVSHKEDCGRVYDDENYYGTTYATGQLVKVGEVKGHDDYGIYAAEDDNGTSYYYKDENPNNWVKFGTNKEKQDLYWRVVRINGDGSIRLIYNGPTTSQTGETTQIGTSKFNEKYDDNAYVGYMYGFTGASTYAETHANTNSSTIKTYLDTWYEENLKTNYEQYIDTNAGFCGDRTVDNYTSEYTGDGTGTTKTQYAPYKRLATNTATYKCSNSNDYYTISTSTKGNKALENPIGLITSDEVAYISSFMNSGKTWLNTGKHYWTMSPSSFSSTDASVILVTEAGGITSDSVKRLSGVRAVINLRSDLNFIGTGTTSDPYRISE